MAAALGPTNYTMVTTVGIEWFRDLSITILGFVTTTVLIFTTILVYRLYRTLTSTLLLVNAASKIALDTGYPGARGYQATTSDIRTD
jgi:hypothetical protein